MEDVKNLMLAVQAFATVAIAIFTGSILWRQYQTARAKLRLDLFERRYRVYRGLMDFLAAVVREPSVPNDALGNFYAATDEKRFLFDRDVFDYLEEVRKKAVALRLAQKRIAVLPNGREEERSAAVETDSALLTWFDAQVSEAQKKFEKYLNFMTL